MANFNLPKLEEEILSFWEKNKIFQKSLEKSKKGKKFVFYEGPPTANAKPGIHFIVPRVFKDLIPRFKTMLGYYVERKGGWDTHGLPVELEVEKKLGFKNKKDIESYGIEAFNKKCKESVWTYKKEMEDLTKRIGYWIDLENPYVTYDVEYMETLWWIIQKIWEKNLLYKDFRVAPYCYRCGTTLSSHELAQGYENVSDRSVYIKFKLLPGQKIGDFEIDNNTYILSWTTTPWTLPGNVALAVGKDIEYIGIKTFSRHQNLKAMYENYIIARDIYNKARKDPNDPLYDVFGDDILYSTPKVGEPPEKPEVIKKLEQMKGGDLAGLKYEPLFDIKELQNEKSYRIYDADFVTTTEGTGVVHTAVMYGEDDFNLGSKVGLPKIHTVNEEGKFNELLKDFGLEGLIVKPKETENKITENKIIEHLKNKNLFLKEKNYPHDYPFCWRCKNPLLYYALDSWFIKMTALRNKMIENNKKINWYPENIKEGRFGQFLDELKDWAFSRSRFWGTPLPIWQCKFCKKQIVIASRKELLANQDPINTLYFLRHGSGEHFKHHISSSNILRDKYHLTEKGKREIRALIKKIKSYKVDLIICSDFIRAKETAQILADVLNLKVIYDERIREFNTGIYDGRPIEEFYKAIGRRTNLLNKKAEDGETLKELKSRILDFIKDLKIKYKNKNILIVSHKWAIWLMEAILEGLTWKETMADFAKLSFKPAELRKFELKNLPFNSDGEIDIHRPYIDEIKLKCPDCSKEMERVESVVDVWFDSGSMPLAQNHFPFDSTKTERKLNYKTLLKNISYPADYIAEAIDQTRGWFYTLLAVSTLLDLGPSYKNVLCHGLLLDARGKKMSKSKGNIVEPYQVIEKYGADALRWYFYTINEPGNSKLFKIEDVANSLRNFILIYLNVLNLIEFYFKGKISLKNFDSLKVKSPINLYILASFKKLSLDVKEGLSNYKIRKSAVSIERFIVDDLSRFYIRIIRNYLREEGLLKEETTKVLIYIVLNLSKILAPFCPFVSEIGFRKLKKNIKEDTGESVHLANYPEPQYKIADPILKEFDIVRKFIDLGFALRKKLNIRVRQPLAKFYLNKKIKKEYFEYLKTELNIMEIICSSPATDLPALIEGELKVWIDPKLDENLKNQGLVREVIRKIQTLRKINNLKPENKMSITVEDFKDFVKSNEDFIKDKGGVIEILYAKLDSNFEKIDFEENFIKIRINKGV